MEVTASTPRLRLDPSARRFDGGRVLVGGSPMTLLRLTDTGARLLDTIESDLAIEPTPATAALVSRLLDAGLVHPLVDPIGVPVGPTLADVTVVVPAHETAPGALAAIIAACQGTAAVVVVDDASPTPIAALDGATVVRRSENGGPGAARSTGLDHVATPFVAFVDADVTLTSGWLHGLLPHLADDRVAMVAPRVAGRPDAGRIARYEVARSPLDLGHTPARVRAGTRVSYVPAAAVVARVAALEQVGGFDQSLRLGEDVDLVWRLDAAGWRVRYEPTVVVQHQPRRTLRAFAAQRFGYGSSGGPLATRHPGALSPVRVTRWAAASWTATAIGFPLLGAGAALASTARLTRTLRAVPGSTRITIRLAAIGHLYAGRSLAAGVTRAWWPVAMVAGLMSRRCRRAVLAAVIVPAGIDWLRQRPALDPASYVVLRVLDDASYGAGLITGAVRERSLDALRPVLS